MLLVVIDIIILFVTSFLSVLIRFDFGNIPDIYLHGREIDKNEVPVKILYQYQDTILKVNVFVHQGNEDKTDINISEIVRLKV